MPVSTPPGFDPFDPFGESADPRRYVPLATFERLLAELAAKVRDRASPILVTGPSGVGKTLLLRMLGERERLRGQRVVYSPFFNLPPEDCARWLLHLLGIAAPRGPQAEAALLEDLHTFGVRPTLVLVDEIQAAPEASVRKLAELAQAGRPPLSVVVAGSPGRPLHRRLPALRPERTLRFPESLPDAELATLCGAILARPEFSAEQRKALAPLRDEIVSAASGLPRLLKAELEVRMRNVQTLRKPRRRLVEELCLDTWKPQATSAAVPSRERAPEPPRSAAPLETWQAPVLAAAPRRERAGEASRSAPPRPSRRRAAAAREALGVWASLALREAEHLGARSAETARREAQRIRVRCEEPVRRAARSARARRAVALAWSRRAAREAAGLSRRSARGAASALGEAGALLVDARRAALPAAALVALVLLLLADHRSSLDEIALAYRTPAAQGPALAPEPADLPASAAQPASFEVQAQINARPWARIRIDGVDVGSTPLSHRLAPGVYRIDAEFADGRSLRRSVEIGPEQRFVALP